MIEVKEKAFHVIFSSFEDYLLDSSKPCQILIFSVIILTLVRPKAHTHITVEVTDYVKF